MKPHRILFCALLSFTLIAFLSILPETSHSQTFYNPDLTVTVCVGSDCGDVTPPTVPTGLAVTAVTASQVNLSWNPSTDPDGGSPPSGVAGYNIYRDGSFVSGTAGTSYSDTGLAAGTLYSYRVRAFDAVGNISNQSSSVSTTTLPAPSPAPNPSGGAPSGTLPAGTIGTTMSLATDIAATCRYGTVADTAYAGLPNIFDSTGGISHQTSLSGLSDGGSYAYYVRCQSLSGTAMADDYIISFAIATPPAPAVVGGGGGGGSPSIPTSVSFSGLAYPNSVVALLKDGVQVASQPAGPDARFNISLSGLAGGVYTFSVVAKDAQGHRSVAYSFTESVTSGAGTLISGIFLPPTISVDKTSVKRGETVTIFGSSVPQSSVGVSIHSADEIKKTVSADAGGLWSYVLNSLSLDYGDHSTQAYAATDLDQSPLSAAIRFVVGDKTIKAAEPSTAPAADFSGDGRVNLVDFSIMSYWYKRPLTPAAAATVDLNGDGKVDLTDFSIMAYNWTG